MRKKFSFKETGSLIKDIFKGFSDDRVPKLSGALAYYTVFSMAPLLVVIISFCGLFLGREAVQGKIYNQLSTFIGPDSASQMQEIIKNAAIQSTGNIAAIIGIVTLLIGATSVFGEIQDSINSIWGVKPKPKRGWLKMLQNRFLSFSVIVGLGFLLLVSLAITGLVEGLNQKLQEFFPNVTIVIFYIINLILTVGISALIFAVIFKVLPDAKIKWKDVFIGALITSLLFLLGKFAISFYISKAKVGTTYGAAGSFVVLLVWVYYSSMILYLGAEFTKVYALKFGDEIHPNDYAVTTKQVEIETGHATIQAAQKVKEQETGNEK